MKPIQSAEQKEKAKKRNIIIVGIIMLFLLVISTASYAFLSGNMGDSPQKSNIQQAGNQWLVSYNDQTFILSNSPEQIANISVQINSNLGDYVNFPLFISSNNTAIAQEIASVVGRYASRTQSACFGNCTEDLPEKDCSDNLIIWKESTEQKVYQADKCIFIEGDLRAVDAFLYKLLGLS